MGCHKCFALSFCLKLRFGEEGLSHAAADDIQLGQVFQKGGLKIDSFTHMNEVVECVCTYVLYTVNATMDYDNTLP